MCNERPGTLTSQEGLVSLCVRVSAHDLSGSRCGRNRPLWWEAQNAQRSQRGRRRLPLKESLPSASGMTDDGYGTGTHRPGAWKPLSKLQCAFCRCTENPLAFAVGEPVTYVQAPKAKGHRDRVSTGFPTSRSWVIGLFAGAHRRRFPSLPAEALC